MNHIKIALTKYTLLKITKFRLLFPPNNAKKNKDAPAHKKIMKTRYCTYNEYILYR